MSAIRILLLEDDPVWRSMLSEFLNREPGLEVTAAAETAAQAVEVCRRQDFDVALLDIHLGEGEPGGIAAAAEIHLLQKPLRIVMLTSMNDRNRILDSFTAGAVQYIQKTRFRELPDCIRQVADQGQLSPQQVLAQEFQRLKKEELLRSLTPAESNIVRLLEEGNTQADIQQKLFIAESTLKNQIGKILKKFGVRSSKEAVKKIKSRGIL